MTAAAARSLQVIRRLDGRLGGSPAAAVHIARALGQHGFAVTVATTTTPDGRRDETRELGQQLGAATIEAFPRSSRLPYDYSRPLAVWLQSNVSSYDVVDIHGVWDWPALVAGHWARRCGVPYVLQPHGSLDPFDLRKHAALKRGIGPVLVRRLLDGAAHIVVTTEREGDDLQTYGSTTPVSAIGLPYQVARVAGDGARGRRALPVEADLVVLSLGRIDYKKGLRALVDAIGLLTNRGRSVAAVIAGEPYDEWGVDFVADVARRGLSNQVLFPGHVTGAAKADLFAMADCFALVSDNENYGLVLVEASAAGLPMVISDQVYLAAQLAEAGAAVVVDRTALSVAAAIEALLDDPEQRSSMSSAATSLMTGLFHDERLAVAQAALRRRLIARNVSC